MSFSDGHLLYGSRASVAQ